MVFACFLLFLLYKVFLAKLSKFIYGSTITCCCCHEWPQPDVLRGCNGKLLCLVSWKAWYTLSDKTISDKSDEIFRWWRKFCSTKNFVQNQIFEYCQNLQMSLNSSTTKLVDPLKWFLCKNIYWNSCSMTQNLTYSDHLSFLVPLQSSNYRESTDETLLISNIGNHISFLF